MKIMMVRDRNVLNTNWVVYLANLFISHGHEVVIACDTYSKLGKTGVGYDIDPKVRICNLSAKTNNKIKNIFIAVRNKIIPPYFRFNKLIEAEQPDILLSYFPTDLYNITRFQNHKAPIIQMVHNYPPVLLRKVQLPTRPFKKSHKKKHSQSLFLQTKLQKSKYFPSIDEFLQR